MSRVGIRVDGGGSRCGTRTTVECHLKRKSEVGDLSMGGVG